MELAKIQKVLDALDECPPLWWADKLLWRWLRANPGSDDFCSLAVAASVSEELARRVLGDDDAGDDDDFHYVPF